MAYSVSSEAGGLRAVVAGHGAFADGAISAIEQIAGRGAVFLPISNDGLCPEDIEVAVSRAIDKGGVRVIFTDLPGGSCTMAVRRLIRDRPGVVLVTGANLALLLDFAMHDEIDPVSAVRQALERGRAAMTVFGV